MNFRRDPTDNHRQHSVSFGLKISKAGALYVAITLLLGFSAVNTGNNLLFLVVSGLLAFMSITGLAGMLNINRVYPELTPPDEVYAGIPAPFRVSLHNTGQRLPSFLIKVEAGNGQAQVFPVLPCRSTQSDTLLLTFPKRGETTAGRITISSPYPVGFFTRYWVYEATGTFPVFPQPLAATTAGGGDESPAIGAGLRRDRGLTGELERIDPYSGAEPLRMIHWKHSARSHELLVKGFGRAVAAPVTIQVDALAGRDLEERLSRAAWLVRRWVRERPVGLVVGDRTVPLGIGYRHGLQLLRELALYDRH